MKSLDPSREYDAVSVTKKRPRRRIKSISKKEESETRRRIASLSALLEQKEKRKEGREKSCTIVCTAK